MSDVGPVYTIEYKAAGERVWFVSRIASAKVEDLVAKPAWVSEAECRKALASQSPDSWLKAPTTFQACLVDEYLAALQATTKHKLIMALWAGAKWPGSAVICRAPGGPLPLRPS